MFHWNTWNVDQDDKRCDKNQIQNFRTGETRGRSESITEGALYWNARDQNTTRRKRNQIKIYISWNLLLKTGHHCSSDFWHF